VRSTAIVGVAASVLIGCVCGTAVVHASTYGIELNGTYRVTSNGELAKTNDVFIDEQTVVQTWTVSSTCQSPMDCTGQVTSDQGWTAPLRFWNTRWIAERQVPSWEPCPDGTAAPGTQQFVFWGVDQDGMNAPKNTNLLAGWDHTTGPSGACGISKPLAIKLPLLLERQA
jgi:hypothetical protein